MGGHQHFEKLPAITWVERGVYTYMNYQNKWNLVLAGRHLLPPFLVVGRPLVLNVEESVEAALLLLPSHFVHLQMYFMHIAI